MKRFGWLLVLLGLFFAASADAAYIRKAYTLSVGDTTSLGSADSSAVLDVRGLSQMYLSIKPSHPCRVAIQIKVYGDSMNMCCGGPALTDTTKWSIWPWGTARNVVNDSLTMRKISYGDNATPAPDELALSWGGFATAGQTTQWTNTNQWGWYIPLCSVSSVSAGPCLQAEYIVVRWRVTDIFSAAGNPVKFRISLHGYGYH